MLKSKIIAILICTSLCVPVFAEPEAVLPQQDETPAQETTYSEYNSEDAADVDESSVEETSSEINEQIQEPTIPYKQPVSKRKIIKKFLLAMVGVVGSAFSIFAFLSLYNYIRHGVVQAKKSSEPLHSEGESSLGTPDNTVDAVRAFLDKTSWD